jgi:antitoxin (DNA-binding transcriptional repressor) of toxin-antitoxin stability system
VRVIDILEAKAQLEELIDELAPGECFVIAKDGVPRVKVIKLTETEIAKICRSTRGTMPSSSRNKRQKRA